MYGQALAKEIKSMLGSRVWLPPPCITSFKS